MARGHKKATGCSTWFVVLACGIGLVQMFSTKRDPPRPTVVAPATVVQAPRPLVAEVPTPVVRSAVTKDKLAKDAQQDPNVKKPSTARARVLFACGEISK